MGIEAVLILDIIEESLHEVSEDSSGLVDCSLRSL
jgi:hypothetical protein